VNTPVVMMQKNPPLMPALGLISLVAGILIVFTYEQTLPFIEANKQRAIEAAVLQLVPTMQQRRDFVVDDGVMRLANEKESRDVSRIYAGYDADGALAGLALPGSAQGYQGMLRLLYSYNPDCSCITGMKIVQATETPGLGDKIAFDKKFLANFNQLAAGLNSQGTSLEHDIVAVRHGRKQHAWEIDAISGATVSSKAVAKAINRSAAQLLPVVRAKLKQFTEPSDANR